MQPSDLTCSLPEDLAARVRDRMAAFRQQEVVRRIWDRDPSVWSRADEDRWLGWLTLPMERDGVERAVQFASEIKAEGITSIVLLGMGGSSLAPEVVRSIVGREEGYPDLHVLDSTDPAQIRSVERAIDFARSLFLVATKSGTTLEVNILKQHFFHRAVQELGQAQAGRHFVLTTDPGSKMEQSARQENFRAIFPGISSVGGRYSALSNFGLLPAALIGVDPGMLLDRAQEMARRCASNGPDNVAFELGVVLGEAAIAGYDKPTLIAPPGIAGFGAWLEQLVAESLGKQGKGIIPIDGETPGLPEVYGRDRIFVHVRAAGAPDAAADALADKLERAGHPVVRIDWQDRYALGAEFYRWEFATAVAGAVIGVNPFDQPDVEAAKVVTRRLAAAFEQSGTLPDAESRARDEDIGALIDALREGDYFALLGFIEMNQEHRNALDAIRGIVRDRRNVATTVGFGPRYLHSTGQAHKGGPNSGVFLMITCDDPEDLPVPGQRYTFGTIKRLQAQGDLEVLASRGRRTLHVHLKDIESGLRDLHAAVQKYA
ncbi:MAG: transaldolase [Acidobacteria bacterium]|nr:MAG: transaldolase [Acidobacteriota bacterium]